jgi:hypothetical protein
LVELAVARGDVGEAVEHAAAMLDDKQQRLPEPLTVALHDAILASQANKPASARGHLVAAMALARGIGHL